MASKVVHNIKVDREVAEELTTRELHVGWSVNMGTPAEDVTIAAYNILGTDAIDARDALTPAVIGKLAEIREFNLRAVQALNRGKSPEPELVQLALELQDALQQSVDDFSTPENAESTIKEKGFNDPLIGAGSDKGRIYDQARARVVKR